MDGHGKPLTNVATTSLRAPPLRVTESSDPALPYRLAVSYFPAQICRF
jgi:hypothetical protein